MPPAAAPLGLADLWRGLIGMLSPDRALKRVAQELQQHFGARHVFLVSSGTAALAVTMKALAAASSRRTSVVVPAYTCFSVPGAVLHAGLHPTPCDIDPSTFDFDHGQLEQSLSGDTLCVIAHHLFGIPADIERIRATCRSRGIVVIEDAAQAMGATWKGRPLGTLGDVGIFSFGRGKAITGGAGGAIITNSDCIADAIACQCAALEAPTLLDEVTDFVKAVLMTIFIRPQLYWIPASLPFLRLGETIFPRTLSLKRLSGTQAGLLHHWRRRLRQSIRVRSEAAAEFSKRLQIAWVPGPRHPYLRLPVFATSADEKDRIYARSQELGLGLSAGYPTAITEIPEVRDSGGSRPCCQARRVAAHLLTIPLHHWLSAQDTEAISACLEMAARRTCPPEVFPQAS